MSHYSLHDEIFSFFPLNFLGVLQEQRIDMQGQEVNGIKMQDEKDRKDKLKGSFLKGIY